MVNPPLQETVPEIEANVFLDPSPTSSEEEKALFLNAEQRRQYQLLNRKRELENQQFERDVGNREQFAERAYGLTQSWIGFLFVLTICQFSLKGMLPGLSDTEFITVFTTTTASVFGFWILVGRYLFKPHDAAEDRKAKKQDRKDVKKMLANDE